MITEYNWDSDNMIKTQLSTLILEGKLVPILGSGFTRGCKAKSGFVPSGEDMSDYLRQFAARVYKKDVDTYKDTSFADLCTYYNKRGTLTEKFNYFSKNFTEVELSEEKINFLRLFPKYMYTLNIDDGIENNCSEYKVILPRRNIFEEYIQQYSTIIKVHGDVHYYLNNIEDEELIFNKRQYIDSIKSNTKILSKLKDDFSDGNMLYIGCSLTDEPDLMSVVIEAVKIRRAECQSYYITTNVLDEDKKDILEDYGITACLIISDYNKFYKEIVSISSSSKNLHQPMDIYREPDVLELSKKETTLTNIINSNSLIQAPFDGKIYKPSFFIKRDITDDVIKDLQNNSPVHILYGHRISGKTHCLINIFELIKDKTRYFFPSNVKINDDELQKLFRERNSIFLFDTNCLESEQLYKIVKEKNGIARNCNYVVIAVNSSDRNGLDLMTKNQFYGFTRLKNNFSSIELPKLNNNLQSGNLPTFINKEIISLNHKKKTVERSYTILDNLYMISEKFSKDAQLFEMPNISKFTSTKELSLLILLATKHTLSTYDLFYFDLREEAENLAKSFPIHFEINYYQYNLSRMDSNYKLSSNSRYFLLKFLGEYAKQITNHNDILSSYKHIFACINSAESDFDTPRYMLNYIKFDVLNDVFYRDNKSVIGLIKFIYEGLEDVMNINPQFKHQRAKSIFWLCPDDFIEIKEAVKYVDLAKHDVENLLKTRSNEKLKISLEHIKYTQASIYGRFCALSNYEDPDIIIKSLQYYRDALSSEENYSERMDLIRKKVDKYIYEDFRSLLIHIIAKSDFELALISEATQLANELTIQIDN